MRRPVLILVVAVFAVGCRGGGEPATTTTVGSGSRSPTETITELRQFLIDGDFAGAATLAVPGQAALASLAEGASYAVVADALENGDQDVAANFWSGFAQGVGDVFTGSLDVEDAGTVTQSGVEFHVVDVTPESGEKALIAMRDVDGYRVDLFASFGAGLAGRLSPAVDLLLGSGTEEATVVLSRLQDVVPSLLVAADDPALSAQAVQEVLALVERITRVG
ncbi:MAG: hypothetical protein WB245_08430 [Acidimicrobiia bacterium]